MKREMVLLVRIGEQLCALPSSDIVEMMRPLPVEPLVGMPPFVKGLSIIRGAPVPVVSAAALLGTASEARPTRLVTVRAGQRRVALEVDEVIGLREFSAGSFQELPPLVGTPGSRAISSLVALDAEFLLV